MSEFLPVTFDIPRSAICPKARHLRGRMLDGHEFVPVRAVKGKPRRWRCKNCKRAVRYDKQFGAWVSTFIIEELPW